MVSVAAGVLTQMVWRMPLPDLTVVVAWPVMLVYLKAQTFGTPQQTILAFKYTNITGQATTTVKSGSGILHTICVNTPAATETITIYDNTAGSGTKIGTITVFASTNPCLTYDVNFTVGLTLVTATASSDLEELS